MVVQNTMTVHCIHCPDYDPDNVYDPNEEGKQTQADIGRRKAREERELLRRKPPRAARGQGGGRDS